MSLSQVEKEIEKLQKELLDCNQERKKEIESQIKKQEKYYQHLSPYDHVYLARKSTRPNIKDYINHLFDDFIELHGDRLAKDDGSIIGGIGLFNQQPVTIIGHLKGKTLEDNLKCNFGMSSPEGYRKAMRLMKQKNLNVLLLLLSILQELIQEWKQKCMELEKQLLEIF